MTPYHAFYPGQEVVCVDDKAPPGMILGVKVGEVYKLRWVGMYRSYINGDYLGVKLQGVARPECGISGEQDIPFRAARFRPVVRDRLSTLRSVAAGGPIQGDVDGQGRKVRKTEDA